MKVLIGSDREPVKRISLRLLWEPRDIWIGVFWNRTMTQRLEAHMEPQYLLIYISIIPLLPFCIAIRDRRTES